jgi:hypothetical protein
VKYLNGLLASHTQEKGVTFCLQPPEVQSVQKVQREGHVTHASCTCDNFNDKFCEIKSSFFDKFARWLQQKYRKQFTTPWIKHKAVCRLHDRNIHAQYFLNLYSGKTAQLPDGPVEKRILFDYDDGGGDGDNEDNNNYHI